MKFNKHITALLAVFLFISACKVEYFENPNEPSIVPTAGIMNRVQKRFMDRTRDAWFSGRMMLLWTQYWAQVNYTDEDRYKYRESTNQNAWNDIYMTAQNLIELIKINTDEETKTTVGAIAPNVNQISAARIMLVYMYLHAVELWGDVPYWSYQSTNPNFQANMLKGEDGIQQPKYATQKEIYADMLKSLKEASEAILIEENMIDGDNFYGGDAEKWKIFANSLRLRIANRIKAVYPEAQTHINEAIASGVMSSNEDNAAVKYENNDQNASPMYRAYYVSRRKDFSPTVSFVELLQGKRGNFSPDPRIKAYVAKNKDGFRVGVPEVGDDAEVKNFNHESLPGEAVLAIDRPEYYMEYSEVCFILSEINAWNQDWYEKGVKASMEKWGVSESEIDAYIKTLPPANEENVMTQKYIALYMQPMEAWSEYRRTGYPKTLIKANEPYTYTFPTAEGAKSATFTFKPYFSLTDVPARNKYLLNEKNINRDNLNAAISSMGGDEQTTKLWWAK